MNKRQIKKMMTIQFDKLPRLKKDEFYLVKYDKNSIKVDMLYRFIDMFRRHTQSKVLVFPNELTIEIIDKTQIKRVIEELNSLLDK